jgi:hypothetical protein
MMNAKTVLGAGMQEHLNNCWLVKATERRMDEMTNDVEAPSTESRVLQRALGATAPQRRLESNEESTGTSCKQAGGGQQRSMMANDMGGAKH